MSQSAIFNLISKGCLPGPSNGLSIAIRMDEAHHANTVFTDNILKHLQERSDTKGMISPNLAAHVDHIFYDTYTKWMHDVLGVLSRDLDYSRYGLTDPKNQFLNVQIYNARELAESAVRKARILASRGPLAQDEPPVFLVSLDDMIKGNDECWSEIGFSREFSLKGDCQYGYRGRPGMSDLDTQIETLRQQLAAISAQHDNKKVSFVFLEDNVRHAKTLNWIIDQLDQKGVFAHGHLAGISSCFSCATEEERQAIRHNDRVIPLTAVVDYGTIRMDVVTPRDLIFDGYVVNVNDEMTRLPALFMETGSLFKINPHFADRFKRDTAEASHKFFAELESKLGITIPVKWLVGAAAISHVTGMSADTPVMNVIRDLAPTASVIPMPMRDKARDHNVPKQVFG